MVVDSGPARDEEVARAAEVAAELSDVVYALRLEPDMAFEYVSPSVEALVGYTPAEHYSDPLLGTKLLDPRDADILGRAAQARIGESVGFTVRWRAKDGRIVWTAHRCRKQRRDDGSVVLYGAARDVSVEHELADRLAEAQEKYRLLAENSSDFVFRLDTSGVIEWVSPNVTALLGWSPKEWVGHNRAEFTHPEDIPGDAATRWLSDESGRRGGRVRVRTRSGAYRWVDMSVTDIVGDAGQVIG
ncbi:MAG: PAS domain-containing protein, partial [Actinomycetes bacterium]